MKPASKITVKEIEDFVASLSPMDRANIRGLALLNSVGAAKLPEEDGAQLLLATARIVKLVAENFTSTVDDIHES